MPLFRQYTQFRKFMETFACIGELEILRYCRSQLREIRLLFLLLFCYILLLLALQKLAIPTYSHT